MAKRSEIRHNRANDGLSAASPQLGAGQRTQATASRTGLAVLHLLQRSDDQETDDDEQHPGAQLARMDDAPDSD